MGFPNGWKRKVKLTIQSTKVSGDVSNFPTLLTRANVPAEMLTSGGAFACKSGGGDIRVSSDVYGINPCSVEVVVCELNANPALAQLEVWVRVPFISSANDTDIWLWYGNPDATANANTHALGRNAVWSNGYRGVWHIQALNAVDSTGIHSNASASVDAELGNGIVQNGIDIYKTEDVDTRVPHNIESSLARTDDGNDPLWTSDHGFTIEVWPKTSDNFDPDDISGYTKWHTFMNRGGSANEDVEYRLRWGTRVAGTDGKINFQYRTGATTTTTYGNTVVGDFSTDTQYYIAVKGEKDDGTPNLRFTVRDEVGFRAETDVAAASPVACSSDRVIEIGAHLNDSFCDWTDNGQVLDECRLSAVERTEEWLKTTYETIAAPGAFVEVGTPTQAQLYDKAIQRCVNRGINDMIETLP